MNQKILTTAALLSLVMLGACGSSTGDRAVSGAGIGASVGALGGLIVGAPLEGALIGGAVGAGTGALTNENQINLGRPDLAIGRSNPPQPPLEAAMFQPTTILRMLTAAVALSLAAGCAQEAPPPPQASLAGPELAGAWYQVYFDTNSVAIGDRGQMVVKNVAYVVTNNGATRVTVIGKTDRVGTPAANMALSQRRADTVRAALIGAGVPANRIDTSWTGEGRQDVATSNDVAEQRNRVVDITVVKHSQ